MDSHSKIPTKCYAPRSSDVSYKSENKKNKNCQQKKGEKTIWKFSNGIWDLIFDKQWMSLQHSLFTSFPFQCHGNAWKWKFIWFIFIFFFGAQTKINHMRNEWNCSFYLFVFENVV